MTKVFVADAVRRRQMRRLDAAWQEERTESRARVERLQAAVKRRRTEGEAAAAQLAALGARAAAAEQV